MTQDHVWSPDDGWPGPTILTILRYKLTFMTETVMEIIFSNIIVFLMRPLVKSIVSNCSKKAHGLITLPSLSLSLSPQWMNVLCNV